MRVLVAPAAFKETFSPWAVAEAIGIGVCRALPEAELLACPVADGGDGLLDVILPVASLRERVKVTGPLGDFVSAELGWIDPETAVFESRTACGLALVPVEARDPLRTTTRGVGELIWEASERGARSVIVGLGGSATVDAGTGAARGLGWTFSDDTGAPLAEGGGPLADLGRFGGGGGWALSARIVALTDVASPLVGSDGAAPVFGPQKGASPAAVARLEAGLARVAELFARHGRPELATVPGGGAAGGLGAGLAFFARAELVAGASWVLDRVGFDAALATADLVITAEGRFDRTSFAGKAPGEVVRRAQQARKKVAVVAGAASDLIGVHVATKDGARLDAEGIAALAERVVREAFGLPAP
jgi:glycerate 2-kinase